MARLIPSSRHWHVRATLALTLAGALPAAAAPASAAAPAPAGCVTVGTQPVVQTLRAYARIEPIGLVRLRAPSPGTLRALRVLTGSASVPESGLVMTPTGCLGRRIVTFAAVV